jgi:hypothetical protein
MQRRRVAAIFVIVLAFLSAGFMASQPYDGTNTENRESAKKSPLSPAPGDRKDETSNAANNTNQKPPQWYAPLKGPEWWLVLAAFLTLFVIAWQAIETRRAAEAAQRGIEATQKSVEIQRVAMGQWVDTGCWEVVPKHIQPTATEAELRINFEIGNPTNFPLTLKSVILWTDRIHTASIGLGRLVLPPRADTALNFEKRLEGVKLANYVNSRLFFEIGGVILFIDAFKENREQLFGFHCKCGPANKGEFNRIAFTPPDEEELKAQEKAKQQKKSLTPN